MEMLLTGLFVLVQSAAAGLLQADVPKSVELQAQLLAPFRQPDTDIRFILGKLAVPSDCGDFAEVQDSIILAPEACGLADFIRRAEEAGAKAVLTISGIEKLSGSDETIIPLFTITENQAEQLKASGRQTEIRLHLPQFSTERHIVLFVLSLDRQRDSMLSDVFSIFESAGSEEAFEFLYEVVSQESSSGEGGDCIEAGRFCASGGRESLAEVVRQKCVARLRNASVLALYQRRWVEDCRMTTHCGTALWAVGLTTEEVDECSDSLWENALEEAKADFARAAVSAPSVIVAGRLTAPASESVRQALCASRTCSHKSHSRFLQTETNKDRKSSENSAAWDIWIIIASSVFVVAFVSALVFFLVAWRYRRARRIQQERAANEVAQTMEAQALEVLSKLEMRGFTRGLVEFGLPTCVICLGDFRSEESVVKTMCRHLFHSDCLKSWFRAHIDCPICKRNPTETQPEAFTEQSSSNHPLHTPRSIQSLYTL